MVLLAFATGANSIPTVAWQTDYAQAYTKALEQHRPLAVFIGEGKTDAVRDGITAANGKLLAQNYVSVFIDSSSEAGKKQADAFEMKQGLVISNRTGDKQALRLTGTVSADDLAKSLERFAKADLVVTTTQTSATPPAPFCPTCPNGGCPNGNCPFAR
jgi:hypothetical protein